MARLIVEEGGRRRLFRIAREEFSIGRTFECAVRLADPLASVVHCRLSRAAEGWVLEDAGSKHGTRVNGRPVKRCLLRAGDVIQIGAAKVVYEGEESAPGGPVIAADSRPRAVEPAEPARPRAASRRPRRAEKSGFPAAATAGLVVVGALVLVFGAYKFLRQGVSHGAYGFAKGLFESSDYDGALLALEKIRPADADYEKARALEAEIRRTKVEAQVATTEVDGLEFCASILESFERACLNPPARPAVRTYLKLCDEFLSTYPGHSRTEWVKGKRTSYARLANEGEPPSLEDAAYEAKTEERRHRYARAREVFLDFIRRNEGKPEAERARADLAEFEGRARIRYEDRSLRAGDALKEESRSLAIRRLLEAEEAARGAGDKGLETRARADRERLQRGGTAPGAGG